jgi:hypothetical protein
LLLLAIYFILFTLFTLLEGLNPLVYKDLLHLCVDVFGFKCGRFRFLIWMLSVLNVDVFGFLIWMLSVLNVDVFGFNADTFGFKCGHFRFSLISSWFLHL